MKIPYRLPNQYYSVLFYWPSVWLYWYIGKYLDQNRLTEWILHTRKPDRSFKNILSYPLFLCRQIHGPVAKMKDYKPFDTPYGGRIEWTLYGGNTLVVHLKDKTKVKSKKRWSQVGGLWLSL